MTVTAKTPISQCVKASDFRRHGGVTFSGLAEGEYLVQVETISMASLSSHGVKEIAVSHKLFTVVKPTVFTPTVSIWLFLLPSKFDRCT
ncbi:unnamed protein product [Gongylonema pulchrum]|uniref:Nodal modulator 1 n=1 Tax=Gongylonema pulchrum TaxID=637853 RepID=A0A183DE74_9BILA|nr:unnamed protein product [Gongylonema pulchrum]